MHHLDALLHKAVIEVVGKGEGADTDGFADEQILVLGKADALLQNVVVGFIFVHIAHAIAQHIHQRIPPLHQLHQCKQQDVD